MAIPAVIEYHLPKIWDDEFKTLTYINEPFNDPVTQCQWESQGYQAKFTGDMCDMRHALPAWSNQIVEIYQALGWRDIGLSFYRMSTGTILPVHQDVYRRYVQLFDLQGKEQTIHRALIFLEDWKSGHYLEINGQARCNWRAGYTVQWVYDVPHMAANIGLEDRYTLQVTGHV